MEFLGVLQYNKVELERTSALSFGLWSWGSKMIEAWSGTKNINKAIKNLTPSPLYCADLPFRDYFRQQISMVT